jgi:DUF3025 family protein
MDGAFFDQPFFSGYAAYRDLLVDPDIDRMNRLLAEAVHEGHHPLRFVAQTSALLADGLHYEQRIAEQRSIATREANPHDLFNALVWLRHTQIKRAMNARQMADIVRVGSKQRTRGQCALTHFDEAGAIVWLADSALVPLWDAHDWQGLFQRRREDWGTRIAITIVGHALFEYALVHDTLPVAKALAVAVDGAQIRRRCTGNAVIGSWPEAEHALAADIASGQVLADPQELRPLPLAGIPHWNAAPQTDAFYATAACFRPLRPGRRYPPPLALRAGEGQLHGNDEHANATMR